MKSISGRAYAHYTGIALLMAVAGIIYLTYQTITYSDKETVAQAGILIGILGTVVSGILGFMGGIMMGRHADKKQTEDDDPREGI